MTSPTIFDPSDLSIYPIHSSMTQPSSQPLSPESCMQRAIELAGSGVRSGCGGPFGAVVVRSGLIIAEGENRVTSSGDPTAHAEVVAIRAACEALGTHILTGCEIYASCEPCPMCLGAIEWARLDRLYYAATRKDAANAGFDDERLYVELGKDPQDRELPTLRLLPEQSGEPFALWADKGDKTPY
jgi:guanine deaminase